MGDEMGRLSVREREVVAKAAEGLANKEIARALVPPCSEDTVKKHMRSVFLKWDIANRASAVAIWLRHNPAPDSRRKVRRPQ